MEGAYTGEKSVQDIHSNVADQTYQVGTWLFDVSARELRCGDETVKLEDKIAQVLELLCCHDGGLVSKDELLKIVWEGREVSEQTVPVAVSKLRKALGDNTDDPSMLETVPRKGYRLIVAPSDAVMAEALKEDASSRSPRRIMLAFSLLVIVLAAWNHFYGAEQNLTAPAEAAKPGIILTINDVRTTEDGDGEIQRAIALSELASFYLSQTPDLLVIRHWWNLDAPDPTGGIFTRYGAETPVYSLRSTLINEGGKAAVTMVLSDPKNDEVLWSGLHFVDMGAPGYFSVLNKMMVKLQVDRSPESTGALLAEGSLADERYWMGRYFMELTSEGAAKTADKAWQSLALDYPEDSDLMRSRASLEARWGLGGVSALQDDAGDGHIALIDRAAIALFKDKAPERALTLLAAALEIAPGDHYALSLVAEAKFMQGDQAAAIAALEKAARLAPYARSYQDKLASLEAPAE
jgi:DNA-binding winged helix-turn-helix (wHTH) protein